MVCVLLYFVMLLRLFMVFLMREELREGFVEPRSADAESFVLAKDAYEVYDSACQYQRWKVMSWDLNQNQ
jgi:hypothetical protein